MKFLLYHIIYLSLIYFSHQLVEEYRITSRSGEKLPLHTGLYYAIKNKRSELNWVTVTDMVPTVNRLNSSHWHKFVNSSIGYIDELLWPYMHFSFEKMDDIYYRIFSVSEYGMDCDGEPLEDGYYYGDKHVLNCYKFKNYTNKLSDEFQWSFAQNTDYKLNAIITDFQYEIPSQEVIKQHIKKVEILPQNEFINNSSEKLTKEITKKVNQTLSFEISYSKSIAQSAKYFSTFIANASLSGKILGINVTEGYTTQFVMEIDKDVNRHSNTTLGSIEITYNLNKIIEVEPFQRVKVLSYIDLLDNLTLPYSAKVIVTGVSPPFVKEKRLDSKTMKVLLSKYGFDELLVEDNDYSLAFEISGIFKSSFAIQSVYNVTSLGRVRNSTLPVI